jgi:hypothetical protein
VIDAGDGDHYDTVLNFCAPRRSRRVFAGKDRRLMREAQVNLAIRWFAGYALHEKLPDHLSLTRIRQRWGPERFKTVLSRTVKACLAARIATGEVVHLDATLIRANVPGTRSPRLS